MMCVESYMNYKMCYIISGIAMHMYMANYLQLYILSTIQMLMNVPDMIMEAADRGVLILLVPIIAHVTLDIDCCLIDAHAKVQ